MKHSPLVLVFSYNKHSSNWELETLNNASTKKYTALNRVTEQNFIRLLQRRSSTQQKE